MNLIKIVIVQLAITMVALVASACDGSHVSGVPFLLDATSQRGEGNLPPHRISWKISGNSNANQIPATRASGADANLMNSDNRTLAANNNNDSIQASNIVFSMPANSWLEIPNSRLESVAPEPAEYPNIQAIMGINGITSWSGGVFDTQRNRLIIWGGGHADYFGNEIYAFDISLLKWERLTDPSEPNLCGQVNSDGTPNSRHTYSGIAYIEHADRMFGSGGALACDGGGCGANKTWTFDFKSKQWTDMNPAVTPITGCENVSVYDPETRKVWYFDGPAGLWSYEYDTNTWVQYNDSDFVSYRTAVIDTKRGLLIAVGHGEVLAYNIRGGDYTQKVWETTGGEAFIAEENPGLAYDPVSDRIVGWSGGPVYALDPETKVWSEYNAPGAPHTDNMRDLNGIYGLWRYAPSVNAFVVMIGASENIYFYKFSGASH